MHKSINFSGIFNKFLFLVFFFILSGFGSTSLLAAPDITVTKTSLVPTYSAPNQVIQYSYVVTNIGTETLINIFITDNVVPISNISCGTTTLIPGASTNCSGGHITTQADIDAGSIMSSATATGSGSSTVTSLFSLVTVNAVIDSSLVLTKSADTASFNAPGTVINYSYLVKNTGNDTISGIAINDNLIPSITCPQTTLAPDTSTTCTGSYTTTQNDVDAGGITNSATATGTNSQGDPVTSDCSLFRNNSCHVTIPSDQEPAISVVKSANLPDFDAVGQVITYSYDVTNTGNDTLHNITVTDNKIPSASISCPFTTLAPAATMTCTGSYTTTLADINAGGITNTGTASGMNPQNVTVHSTSTHTVPAIQLPAITITKSSSSSPFSTPGVILHYTYQITNTGNDTLNTIAVTDNKIPSSNIICSTTTLVPSASTTCTATYTTTQADVDAGGVTNTGTVTAKNFQGTQVTNSSSTTVTGIQSPAISLTKSRVTGSYNAAGQTLNYTYQVKNTGNQTLNTIIINDNKVPLANISCAATTLAPNASTTCTGTYTTTQADVDNGNVTNTASAAGQNQQGTVVNSAPSSSIIYANQTPGISLTKSTTATPFNATGVVINYSYTITNTGNETLNNLTISDNVIPSGSISCPVTSLLPNTSTVCTASHTTTQADIDSGGVTNTATVTGQTPSGRTLRSGPSTVTVTAIQMPSITMTKSSATVDFDGVNQIITYSYQVTNTGNDTLNAIKINDNKVATNVINCLATSLAPGASTTCTGTYNTTLTDIDAGGVTNIASASGTNGVGTQVTSTPSTITVPAVQESSLSLTKSTTTTLFNGPNQTITYSYLVKNTGNDTINNIAISDNNISTAITCLATTLAPFTSTTCTATYTTTQADVDAGSVNNSATASGTNTLGTNVISPTSSVVVPAKRTDAVNLTKTASPTSFTTAGTLITYSYLVQNMGNVTITNINIADPHSGLSAISCPVTTLAPNSSTTCTATYTTTANDVAAGSISNSATLTADSPIGTVQARSNLTIQGPQIASVSIDKSANVGAFSAAGDVITYYYVIQNTGNVTLNTLNVSDPHSGLSAISCPSTSLAPGAQMTCSATYTVTAADVSAGSITNTSSVTGTSTAGNANATSNTLIIPFQSGNNYTSLTLTKSASISSYSTPGTTITYSYLVENTGQVTINFTVSDPHAGLSAISCPTNTLAAGAQTTCTATYTTTQGDVDAGSISNTGTASVGGQFQSISSVTINGVKTPSLSLVKTSTSTPFNGASQVIHYEYLVTNTGNQTLNSLNVIDNTIPSVNLVCPATTLAPGIAMTCTGSYETTQNDVDAGGITNVATASALSPQGTPVNAGSTTTVAAIPLPAIMITKSTTTDNYSSPGDILTYSYLIRNTGNDTLTNIAVSDTKVASVTCQTTTLAPNTSTICSGTYTVTQADLDAGSVENIATASGTNPQGTTVTNASNVIIYAALNPSLTLTKTTVTPTYSAPGDTISYSYQITNNGNDTISNLNISDNKIPSAQISCSPTTLAPGDSATCSAIYTVTQADLDAAQVTNIATATGQNPQGSFVRSTSASTTVNATLTPSITLTKSASPSTFDAPNQVITYTYVVTNTGNDTLRNILIADDKVDSSQIFCSTSTLAPNASMTCTATYQTVQADVDAGSVVNTAVANSQTPQGVPVSSSPASATVTAILNPSIFLQKSTTATTFTGAGQTIPYTYVVKNTGNDTLNSIIINDDKVPTANITCATTTLAPNESTTCTGSYVITVADIDANVLTNTATASAQNPQGTEVTSAPSSVSLIPQQQPAITVQKSANISSFNAPGTVITYSYLVTNTGNDTLHTIKITDNKVPAANISCPLTTLAPTESTTCTGTYVTTLADIDANGVTNTASSSGINNLGTTVKSPNVQVTVPAVQEPAISIVKSSSTPNYTDAGQFISYSYTVRNIGNDTLHNIVVSDNKVTTTITCAATTLAPNATTTCSGMYETTLQDVDNGSVTNIATASGRNTQNVTVTSAESSVTVPAIQEPSLNITKSKLTMSYDAPGQTIQYSYLVKNTGNDTLSNIVINDDIVTTAITCSQTTLAPEETTTCTGSYVTTQADVDAGSVTNISTASATDPFGEPVISAESTVTVDAILMPSLILLKSTPTPSFDGAGQNIIYNYQVTNNGNQTIHNLMIIDDKVPSAQISCMTTTLAPGAFTTCSGTYVTTLADVDAGEVTNDANAVGLSPQDVVVISDCASGGPRASACSVTVPAIERPAITLTKSTTSNGYFEVGQTIDYNYLVTNTGNDTLNNITITDNLVAPGNLSCPSTPLAPGMSTTCTGTYITTSADLAAGSITNTAVASGTDGEGTTVTSAPSSVTVYELGGAISITKSASIQSFAFPGTPVTYTYVVSNTGLIPLHDVAVNDSNLGNISCPLTALAPNQSMTCTASYTTTLEDVKEGKIVNTATATGVTLDGSVVTSQASATIGLDPDYIRKRTLAEIRDFINDRAQLVLSAEPDRRRILNRLSVRNTGYCESTTHFKVQPSPTGESGTIETSTSLQEVCYGPSKVDVWVEAHGMYFNKDNSDFTRRGQFGVGYLGIDYLFTPSILVGILSQADAIHQRGSSLDVGNAHGQGWLVGPYLSARLKPDLYLHTRAAWGGSSNKINVFGLYEDSFRTTRSLYNAELIGDWFIDSVRISPTLGATYYSEIQRKFVNGVGITIPSQRVNLGQINVGPEVAYLLESEDDRQISLRVSLQGLYNFDQNNGAEIVDEDISLLSRFSARIKLGAEFKWPSGLSITPMLTYDGVGENVLTAGQAQIQVNLPLG